jgi:hypothetical protein
MVAAIEMFHYLLLMTLYVLLVGGADGRLW